MVDEEIFVPLKEISGRKKRIISEKVKFGFFCLTEKVWYSKIKNVRWWVESCFIAVKFFVIILTFIIDVTLAVTVVFTKNLMTNSTKLAKNMVSSIWSSSLNLIVRLIIIISIPLILISIIIDFELWEQKASYLMSLLP